MVDSGAEGNYISPETVNRLKLPWKNKKEPYDLANLEGELFGYDGGVVNREIDHLKVYILERNQGVNFDIITMQGNDIVLGHPWLHRFNPNINWRTGQVHLDDDAPSTDEGSDTEERSQNSITNRTDDEFTRGMNPPPIPKGTRSKREKRTRRTIARVVRQIHDLNRDLQKQEEESEDRLKNIPDEYRIYNKLFAEELETGLPEHGPWDLKIEIRDGENPGFGRLINLNEIELSELRRYLEEMLRKGYIRRSTSSAGHPVFFVPKKNGKVRLVIDYRRLNDMTLKDRTPLPLITEMKDRLHGMKWFTALDLKGAYNLVRIAPGHEWKTAFRTKYGLFEYLVMPFGLTNAPAAFQTMINHVLREYLDIFVVCYLDDILIFSKSEEEHTEHVHRVLNALQEANLLVEPEKSKFHAQEVEFLGHIISPNEIRMDPKKISAVKDWPRPTNLKEVQSFLGFANYYRKFIKGFGGIAGPLTEFTKKGKDFRWGTEAQKAFNLLKNAILSEPVLQMFDPDKETELETDASDYALGGQVGQRDENGKLHPIAFYSHKLHGAELNYPIYDKEFLAIVNSFKEFRHYLLGGKHKVKVYTDHKNITHFATTQQLSGRQLRYAEYLSEFDYVIIHKKGTENGRADAISRRADFDTERPRANEQILKYTPEGYLTQKYIATVRKNRAPPSELLEEMKKPVQTFEGWMHNERPKSQGIQWENGKITPTGDQGSSIVTYYHQRDHHGDPWRLAKEINQYFNGTFAYACIAHMSRCNKCPQHLLTQHCFQCKRVADDHEDCQPEWSTPGKETREQLIREIHEHQLHGHPGVTKTMERLKRYHSFPKMKKEVEEIIKTCDLCSKAKARRHKPYGKLQPLPVAERPWNSITMDFITKLPISEDPTTGTPYDSVFVIVDRFTKFAYYIPYQESSSAEDMAYIFLRNIVAVHGLPNEILSDRGTTFASKFWQGLMSRLGLNHRLTTAFRASVDGQTERLNQELEAYLRCYVNYEQTNWVEKLPTAQLAYNTSYHSSTRLTPAYANFGFTPDPYHEQKKEGPLNVQAILTSDKLKELHEEMKTELEFVRNRMKQYYDQKRIDGPTFEEGDMVLLSTKNITTRRQSKKLDYKYIGPYKVVKRISENNYELNLPPKVRLHPIFHISLLEPAKGTIVVKTGQNDVEVDGPEEHKVERILDKQKIEGKTHYLVKWQDYDESENTWEPPEHLTHAQKKLKDFLREQSKVHPVGTLHWDRR